MENLLALCYPVQRCPDLVSDFSSAHPFGRADLAPCSRPHLERRTWYPRSCHPAFISSTYSTETTCPVLWPENEPELDFRKGSAENRVEAAHCQRRGSPGVSHSQSFLSSCHAIMEKHSSLGLLGDNVSPRLHQGSDAFLIAGAASPIFDWGPRVCRTALKHRLHEKGRALLALRNDFGPIRHPRGPVSVRRIWSAMTNAVARVFSEADTESALSPLKEKTRPSQPRPNREGLPLHPCLDRPAEVFIISEGTQILGGRGHCGQNEIVPRQ